MRSPLITGKLSIGLGRSKSYCLLLGSLYCLSAVVLLRLEIGFWVTLFIGLSLLTSLFHELCIHVLRNSARAVIGVECEHGVWWLTFMNKDRSRFTRVENVVVLDWLVILNFRDSKAGDIALPILFDSLSERDFRHLRAYLNMKLDHPKVGGINMVST
jgi:hypothetical protein